MRILLTGAAGYTGRGIAQVLREQHRVRGLDVHDAAEFVDDAVVGNIARLEDCQEAMREIDALVLCHMAPSTEGYKAPTLAFDINVTGTAHLYHAALEHGISRVVMISSTGVLPQGCANTRAPGEGPYQFAGSLYAFTKAMQECVARHYFEAHGIATAIIRPAWILYDETFITKYGNRVDTYHNWLIDPRDIGTAVLNALTLPDLGLEAFNIGQDDADFDLTDAHARLSWQPQYRFSGLPRTQQPPSR